MKKFLHSNVAYLVMLMVMQAPFRVLAAVLCKAAFIILQVSAIWIMIIWVRGSMLPLAQQIVGAEPGSLLYPILSGGLLIGAACSSCLARSLGLGGVKKVEQLVMAETSGKQLHVGDYRNLAKLLLAVIDSFVPLAFIMLVILVWIYTVPALMLPLAGVLLIILFFFRQGARFSARYFKLSSERLDPESYVGSEEQQRFYRTLMLPQYITVGSYIFIAAALVAVVVSIKTLSAGDVELGLLPIASALAVVQFRSFVGLLVRFGAYSRNVSKIVALIRA
ncbi:hypothetical protein QKW35_01505 [Pontibacterium granulatum]|uniref:hypothetical protein n=1 Tax=Pontibacterium granulatum TaxID=2036029 RepID=UPI00249A2F47|nr:hypothetical protein [Pontibacterium granulatum]MDI3323039.1 hypothetical protein [Pontibacterium granulatum]